MVTESEVNAYIIGATVLGFGASFFKRGMIKENLVDAVLDGLSVSQLPVGVALLFGLMGLVEAAAVAKLMTDSMIGLWGGLLFVGLGAIAAKDLLKLYFPGLFRT